MGKRLPYYFDPKYDDQDYSNWHEDWDGYGDLEEDEALSHEAMLEKHAHAFRQNMVDLLNGFGYV